MGGDAEGEERSGSLEMSDCKSFGVHMEKLSGRKKITGKKYRLAWLLQCMTGRRGMDIRQLTYKDVPSDLTRVRVGDTKNRKIAGSRGKCCWVPIAPKPDTKEFLTEALKDLKEHDGARQCDKIFGFGYEAFEKKIREARTSFTPKGANSCPADLITSHTPRRSLASHLYRQGAALSVIMKMTGHTNVDSLMHYIHSDYSILPPQCGKLLRCLDFFLPGGKPHTFFPASSCEGLWFLHYTP